MSKNSQQKTLSDAIEDLESLSTEGLTDQITRFKKLIEDFKPQLEKAELEAKKVIDEKPMLTLGLTALLFLIVGFFIGRSGKRS